MKRKKRRLPQEADILDANGVLHRTRHRNVVGRLINFRGLVYAPVNENGVIFLFGKVAADLNMYVETIRPGYPDCVAKRYIGKGKWEELRIEFEFRSSDFVRHKHHPDGSLIRILLKNLLFSKIVQGNRPTEWNRRKGLRLLSRLRGGIFCRSRIPIRRSVGGLTPHQCTFSAESNKEIRTSGVQAII